MALRVGLVLSVVATSLAGCAAEAQRFDWDELGASFCRHAVAEDVAALGPFLTPGLRDLIGRASAGGAVPARMLLQGYDAAATGCTATTRNAAIVEVRRTAPGQPAWTDYLVVVPERDGSTRIDDILFATRRSDTLRERLRLILAAN
jgi:hypothetical protein